MPYGDHLEEGSPRGVSLEPLRKLERVRKQEHDTATHVAALGLLERLCALQPFQTLLESEGSIFNLLFRLRDHRADEVRDLAEEIARRWEGTFFGWSWRCDVHLCDRHVVGQPQVPTACAPRETAAFDRHLRPPRVTATPLRIYGR